MLTVWMESVSALLALQGTQSMSVLGILLVRMFQVRRSSLICLTTPSPPTPYAFCMLFLHVLYCACLKIAVRMCAVAIMLIAWMEAANVRRVMKAMQITNVDRSGQVCFACFYVEILLLLRLTTGGESDFSFDTRSPILRLIRDLF